MVKSGIYNPRTVELIQQRQLQRTSILNNIVLNKILKKNTSIRYLKRLSQIVFKVNIGRGRTRCITFLFIDKQGNAQGIQAKLFDKDNHTTETDLAHSIIEREFKKNKTELPYWLTNYKQNDLKVSCLLGELLLPRYSNNPVALVEEPKTAIYGTLYLGFPDNPKNPLKMDWRDFRNRKLILKSDRLRSLLFISTTIMVKKVKK